MNEISRLAWTAAAVSATVAVAAFLMVMPARAETCMASHYGTGDGYGGRKTANGERMNPQAMTAAHKTLPFGTRVRVTGSAGSVVVRINDRGPFIKGRCIDMSTASMRHVCGNAGVCRVTVARL